MNAPWWRMTTDREKVTQGSTGQTGGTVRVEQTDDVSDLLPPFYD